jgi:basic membrane lipoprotein Med (substrate-binding protein (PBP1-ABC) superfamily)/DNA-binding SARP family transcriptional activator
MQFRILGSLEVAADDGAPAELGPPKQRALLAGLILHVGEIVSIDQLTELLWGAEAPRTAAHSIQIYVSELRKALAPLGGAELIVTRPPGYLLEIERDAVDAWRFERLAREGRRLLEAGEGEAGRAALAEALGLWRGPALADFVYEDFAGPAIERLDERHLEAIEALAAAELEAGHPAEVIHLLEGAVREDPLRERARELLMLALYRAGRHADALRTYDALRIGLADELGVDPSPPVRALYDRILLHDPTLLLAAQAAAGPEVRNPYKGLRAFTETDAADFFGRDDLVEQLLDALREGRRLVALVGPSGSGKSSVLAAGLVPRLREGALEGSERWHIVRLAPGASPLREAAALGVGLGGRGGSPDPAAAPAGAGAGHPGLLVIDQFEQLFAVAPKKERDEFLATIAQTVAGPAAPLRFVLALRADFYDRPLLHPAFAAVFTSSVVNVVPMTARELEAAVVEPARRVGVEVEPALLAELIADTADRPGSLPLLQYALTELFEQRAGPSLGQAGYAALGGLRGLLSRRAEAIYGGLDPEAQDAALQVFLRLVQPGSGAAESRRRVALAELTDVGIDPVALSEVLTTFGRHRLLTFDRDPLGGAATVELAHEALLVEWERLAGWLERHRADLRRHATLVAAAEEWEESGRDPDYLLVGSRLEGFEAWRRATALRVAERERAFLEASLERRRADEASFRETRRRLGRAAHFRVSELIAEGRMEGPEVVARAPDVVLVWEGYGDGGWNDAIGEGFDRAVEELGLHADRRVLALESRDPLVSELTRLSNDGAGLIVVGSASEDLAGTEAVADQHPDCHYVLIDVEGHCPNVTYVALREEQGAFLAGAAAALKSETGIVGLIGGTDNEVILRFAAGFEAGARIARPDIDVRVVYVQLGTGFSGYWGFANPRKASDEASRLYRTGVDVIQTAAGTSGYGVFDAARRCSVELGRHLWAIGVDSDQYETVAMLPDVDPEITAPWRDHILTSLVKRYDVALSAVLRDYVRGRLVGGTRSFDLRQGATELAHSGGFIDDIRPQLDELRQRIIDGTITVPIRPREAASVPGG